VCFVLLGVVVFCLDLDPFFFFFSCSLVGCFSFIYLFILKGHTSSSSLCLKQMPASCLSPLLLKFIFKRKKKKTDLIIWYESSPLLLKFIFQRKKNLT
jgi:hypothetical protein